MLQPGRRPATVLTGDFDSWLAAREPALQRVAALLGGDPASGRALLRPVLARVCAEWRQVGPDGADDRARELLLAAHRRTWSVAAPEPAAVPLTEYDDPALAAWSLVAAGPPRVRAVLVLRYHQLLDPDETGRLLHLAAATVRADERAALDALAVHRQSLLRADPARRVPAPDRLLSETLHERGEQATYLPTPADDVHAAAGDVRARRRGTTLLAGGVVGAALVAAIATGTALVDPRPADPPGRPPSSSSLYGPLGSFERSHLPDLPFLVDNVLHNPDGTALRLPVLRPGSATAYRGHVWVTDLSSDTLRRVDPRGREVGSWPTAGDPVVSGATFAWVERPRHAGPVSAHLIHRGPQRQRAPGDVRLAGLVRGRVVYNSGGRAWITDLEHPPAVLPSLATAWGVDGTGLAVSGVTRDGDGVVIDVGTGRVRWRTPYWHPGPFSPDGRHVLAVGATRARIVHAVLDAHRGSMVTEIDWMGPGPGVLDARWEDDEHLLLLAVDQGETVFLRAGLDGSIVRAGPPLVADEAGSSRYRFATR
jgi:DNA-directed RNA polymerase specialized sigma24 family protein